MSEKNASTFSLRYAVTTTIAASPEVIWNKLTDAAGFAAWNSTVESVEGRIAVGERLAIRVPIAPGRTFKPRVVELVPRSAWCGATASTPCSRAPGPSP